MSRYGNETVESVEGHRSTINFSDWRPLGWTDEQEAAAEAKFQADELERRSNPIPQPHREPLTFPPMIPLKQS